MILMLRRWLIAKIAGRDIAVAMNLSLPQGIEVGPCKGAVIHGNQVAAIHGNRVVF